MSEYSKHVFNCLRSLSSGEKPSQYFNPGVCQLVIREGLAESVVGPAINKKARPGETIPYLKITDAGRRAVMH